MFSRSKLCSCPAARATGAGSRGRTSLTLTALMAGLLASSGAQAQCHTGLTQLFPFGNGGGVNALTSVIDTVNIAFLTTSSAFVSAPEGVAPDELGGGVWARAIGGTVDTKATSNFNGQFVATVIVPPSSSQVLVVNGLESCGTKVRQDYGGFQTGHDISILNEGNTGANWHVGVTAGYVEAGAKDTGGTFTGNFEVPFAGVYTAFSKSNFFADGQARLDYFQSELNDPLVNGIINQRLDARGYSLIGNVGYRFDLPEKWFIESSVGGVLSRVSVDPFDVTGTLLLPMNPGVAFPGTAQVHDIESELGRASMRVGTSISLDDELVVAQPFFTASVFHEFAGNVTSTVSTNGSASAGPSGDSIAWSGAGTFTTSRVGTYAQFGVGSAFQFVNTGWLAYVRADYRTGESIEGFSVNAGLRYQLTPEMASLKNGGSLKDSPAEWGGYDWTGFYMGGSIGSTWGGQHWFFPSFGTATDPDFAGLLAGVQAGYNYQMGRMVVGMEGDFGFSNARGARPCPSAFFFSCEDNVDQLGSLSARLGYTLGRALLYAKGGLTFGEVTAQGHLDAGTTNVIGFSLASPVSTTIWAGGWTGGGGMEFALTEKLSAKAEYMHYDLGKDTYTVDNSGFGQIVANASGNTVRVGVNYHIAPYPTYKE